jgi:hypothetical protein
MAKKGFEKTVSNVTESNETLIETTIKTTNIGHMKEIVLLT